MCGRCGSTTEMLKRIRQGGQTLRDRHTVGKLKRIINEFRLNLRGGGSI